MRAAVTVVCVVAALVMIGVSASMNFLFMRSLAIREIDGQVLGAASASADMLKAALPWLAALAWARRRFLFAAVASVVFAGFSMFSLLSSLGFAAELRSGLVGVREASSAALALKEKAAEGLAAPRVALGAVRAAALIDADMAIARQDARWGSTKGCQDATLPASRSFCKDYLALEAERVASDEAARIDDALARLKVEIAALKAGGAGGEADPQVAVIARLLGEERDVVRTMLIVAAALLVEAGSGLGLWLALGAWEPRDRRPDNTVAPVAAVCISPSPELVTAALPAPQERGEVMDFCLDRVHPAHGSELTILGLYRSYEVWCRDRDLAALPMAEFGAEFQDLAREVGIAADGDRVRGIRVGIGLH